MYTNYKNAEYDNWQQIGPYTCIYIYIYIYIYKYFIGVHLLFTLPPCIPLNTWASMKNGHKNWLNNQKEEDINVGEHPEREMM